MEKFKPTKEKWHPVGFIHAMIEISMTKIEAKVRKLRDDEDLIPIVITTAYDPKINTVGIIASPMNKMPEGRMALREHVRLTTAAVKRSYEVCAVGHLSAIWMSELSATKSDGSERNPEDVKKEMEELYNEHKSMQNFPEKKEAVMVCVRTKTGLFLAYNPIIRNEDGSVGLDKWSGMYMNQDEMEEAEEKIGTRPDNMMEGIDGQLADIPENPVMGELKSEDVVYVDKEDGEGMNLAEAIEKLFGKAKIVDGKIVMKISPADNMTIQFSPTTPGQKSPIASMPDSAKIAMGHAIRALIIKAIAGAAKDILEGKNDNNDEEDQSPMMPPKKRGGDGSDLGISGLN